MSAASAAQAAVATARRPACRQVNAKSDNESSCDVQACARTVAQQASSAPRAQRAHGAVHTQMRPAPTCSITCRSAAVPLSTTVPQSRWNNTQAPSQQPHCRHFTALRVTPGRKGADSAPHRGCRTSRPAAAFGPLWAQGLPDRCVCLGSRTALACETRQRETYDEYRGLPTLEWNLR